MSLRSGFVARSFMPFGTLMVSFGYGGLEQGVIKAPVKRPEEVLLEIESPHGVAAKPHKPRIATGQKKPRKLSGGE